MIIHGWTIVYSTIFSDDLHALRDEVRTILSSCPKDGKSHPKAKLLKALLENIKEVARNPDHPQYRLGNTLKAKHSSWRRVKRKGLPARYRAFFKFSSTEKRIYWAWFNDDTTLRQAGAKTDVYTVFEKLLENSRVVFQDSPSKTASPRVGE